jgi:hypothetical protein
MTLPSTRVLQRTAATISSPILDGGGDIPVALPPDATVTITRSDGTVLVSAGIAGVIGDGSFSYQLTPTDTALLDNLTVEWTNSAVGTTVSYVEIVGGFLFTVPEARKLPALGTQFSTADIIAMRNTVEDAIEGYTGALVPRFATDTLSGDGTFTRPLLRPFVRSLRSVTLDGSAVSLTGLSVAGGWLNGALWTAGYNNLTVGYEHGRDRPPERLRRAALLLAKTWLVASPVDDRASTFSSAEGGTYSMVTAGVRGSLFGVPEVDAAVQAEMLPAIA